MKQSTLENLMLCMILITDIVLLKIHTPEGTAYFMGHLIGALTLLMLIKLARYLVLKEKKIDGGAKKTIDA